MTLSSTSVCKFALGLSAVALLLVGTSPSLASVNRVQGPLPVDLVLDQAELRGPAVSPDERLLAYSVCKSPKNDLPIEQVLGECSLWITDRDSGRSFQVSERAGLLPSWSPDSRLLAFQAYEGNELRLWLWRSDDGKARQVSELRLADFGQIWQPAQWLSDGHHVLVKYAIGGGRYPTDGDAIQQSLPSWARKNTQIPLAIRASRAMTDAANRTASTEAAGVPFLSDVGIALVDVTSGKHRIVKEAGRVSGARLSPDGSSVLFTQIAGGYLADAGSPTWELRVIDIESGREQALARDMVQYHGMNFSWSPDSRWVAYLTGPQNPAYVKERGAEPTRLTVVAANGSSRKTFEGSLASEVAGYKAPQWACDSRSVSVYGDDGVFVGDMKSSRLQRVAALDGFRPRTLLVGSGTGYVETAYRCRDAKSDGVINVLARDLASSQTSWLRVSRNGRVEADALRVKVDGMDSFIDAVLIEGGRKLLGVAQTADVPPEMFEFDFKGKRKQLTDFNRDLSRYALGKVQLLDFEAPRGMMKAAVLLPVGYEEGRRYPAVLEMYPGTPMASGSASVFGMGGMPFTNAQILATRGYAVVMLDSEVGDGTLARDIADTANAAADELIRRGIVDPERLAVRGCSHAGYAVLATLMNTDRFKAGIAECAFGDLGAFVADGWKHFIQLGSGKMRVAPWEDPQRYIENSPFYFAHRIKTPLMLVVGGKDGGFVTQTKQMFYALDELGREVTLLNYETEAHGLSEATNVADFWPRLIAFLDAKLKYQEPLMNRTSD